MYGVRTEVLPPNKKHDFCIPKSKSEDLVDSYINIYLTSKIKDKAPPAGIAVPFLLRPRQLIDISTEPLTKERSPARKT